MIEFNRGDQCGCNGDYSVSVVERYGFIHETIID